MPLNHLFNREDIFPSYFANRFQDFLSAAHTGLRLSLKSATVVEVVPDSALGIAAVSIEGRWRWVEEAVERNHPGGAKGTYVVWAVATDEDIDNSPDPFTDHTDYAFELRITSGAEPEGAGIEIVQKIGEIDWSGAEIEAIRQTYGTTTGAMLGDDALPSKADSDLEWKRQPGGGYLLQLKANAVGASELADNAVDTNAIVELAVTTAKIAALAITEGKLAANSVAQSKIIDLAVTTSKIAALAVTEEKLAGESVSTAKIKALAVTAAKLAAEAVETGKIKNLAVTAAKLAEAAVTESKIADAAVSSRKTKLTAAQVDASGDLNIRETSGIIPGTEEDITVAVSSLIVVTAVFDFIVVDTHAPHDIGSCVGSLQVDGVKGTKRARLVADLAADTTQVRGTVSLTEVRALSAGEHTLRLHAEGNASGNSVDEMRADSDGTCYSYLVTAA